MPSLDDDTDDTATAVSPTLPRIVVVVVVGKIAILLLLLLLLFFFFASNVVPLKGGVSRLRV